MFSISNGIYLSLWVCICKLVSVDVIKPTINHVILCKRYARVWASTFWKTQVFCHEDNALSTNNRIHLFPRTNLRIHRVHI